MANSVRILSPIIATLTNLIINKKYTMDDTCVMAVVLYQQCVTTFDSHRGFSFCTEFKINLTTYKENDADVGTTNGNDSLISG